MTNRKATSGEELRDESSSGAPRRAPGESAQFLSLSLENVKCFGPRQTLDLSDGRGNPARWTVILGVNGTGKTTLLQLLVGCEFLQTFKDRERRHPLVSYPRLSKAEFFKFYNILRYKNEPCILDLKLVEFNKFQYNEKYEILTGFILRPDGGFSASAGAISPWCCAYGAGRRIGEATLSDSEPGDATASLFSERAELRNPEEWLLRLEYSALRPSEIQGQQKLRLAQVRELLLGILPDIEDIRLTSTGATNPIPRAEFKTPFGWVPLRQLGYGYQTLITWVADLANRMVERYPDSPDPLAEPAVVAVDEIDLHLHPQWQRRLMEFLTGRFSNTQFIVTAHSPLMAQAAAEANLAVLRREGDHVVIDNNPESIKGWRIDQILTSDLFGLKSARPPQMERLLEERKSLLTKAKLTAPEKRRLAKIEEEIGELPTGESAQEVKEREEIRIALELLMKERPGSR